MTEPVVRPAVPGDAAVCAAIHNDWIDSTPWMPRVHSPDSLVRFYSEYLLPKTRMFVVGDPPKAYLSLNDEGLIAALYSALPGAGLGKALLDHAKSLTQTLTLWTFAANTGAQKFYEREGFEAIRRTDGDNEEGLPDILYRWDAAHA